MEIGYGVTGIAASVSISMAPATSSENIPQPDVSAPPAIVTSLFAIASTCSPEDFRVLLTYTRNWIQYGLLGFTVACILIGAVERLFGR
jgi:hypothetical protein